MPRRRHKKKPACRNIHIQHTALLEAQQNKCWICGRFMNHSNPKNWHFRSVDHICPRAALKGVKGEYRHNNIVYACRGCNSSRRDDLPSTIQRYRLKMLHIKAIAIMLASVPRMNAVKTPY